MSILEFEKPIYELKAKIEEIRKMGTDEVDLSQEVSRLEDRLDQLRQDVYKNLTAWQRIQIARHPERPYTLDYIKLMTNDFMELHGDRLFADDQAIVGGLATIGEQKVMVLGHQKGRDVTENVLRNFGCAHPEGYRKAMRLMKLAEKLNLPIVAFVDTPGAYPGVGAEERGQAQAIAENLRDMALLKVPVVTVVIGEGGSGGALGIGVANRVLILENAYYSVISPEGCASILWRNSANAPDAAEALKLTGEHLQKFGIVDEVVPEPHGGAHHSQEQMAGTLKEVLLRHISELKSLSSDELVDQRYERFRKIGEYVEKA